MSDQHLNTRKNTITFEYGRRVCRYRELAESAVNSCFIPCLSVCLTSQKNWIVIWRRGLHQALFLDRWNQR